MEKPKISIIGAGSWGTTLALLLGEKGYEVVLWARRKELADEINRKRQNPQYLKGIALPDSLKATASMGDVGESGIVVFAVPSEFLRQTARSFSKHIGKDALVLHVVKGIEFSTGKLMSQILEEELGKNTRIAVLSGPNHAEEVARKLPTATVIASKDINLSIELAKIFSTRNFKAYPLDDITGVEICGAIKNIVAIAMGVCHGLDFGDNAKASILTLGLSEMGIIASRLGAKKGTCYGLAGVGDLVATCYSQHSRNRFVGEQLAKGKTIGSIRKEMNGMVAEGIPNTKSIYDLCRKNGINTPLITHAYKVLYGNMDLRKAIDELLNIV